MIPIILLTLVAVVAVFLVIVAMQPAAFSIMRSAAITAAPQAVFDQVNDFHKWDAWSPWARLDPAATNTFEGAPSGVGAVFAWSGNNKVGAGRMTIIDSRPVELIRIRLEFSRPFKATNIAEFTFKPSGDQTLVTWTMTGERNFVCKGFSLVANMDKMVGKEFEKGLAQITSLTESRIAK